MKKLNLIGIFLVAVILSLPVTAMSETAAGYMDEPKAVMKISNEALTNYIRYGITEKNATAFGFKNLDDAKSARVGAPYPVMFLDLSIIKGYQSGTKVKNILNDPGILWFPVLVGDVFRTKIEMIRINDQWKPGEFGDTNKAEKIWAVGTRLEDIVRSKEVRGEYSTFIVYAPSLLATFLYIQTDAEEFLIPSMVNPERYGMENGKAYEADEALQILRRFAVEIQPGTIR